MDSQFAEISWIKYYKLMKGNSTRNDPVIIWYCPEDLNQQASLSVPSFYNLFSGVWWMNRIYHTSGKFGSGPPSSHHFQLNWAIPKLIEAFTHNSKTILKQRQKVYFQEDKGILFHLTMSVLPKWSLSLCPTLRELTWGKEAKREKLSGLCHFSKQNWR